MASEVDSELPEALDPTDGAAGDPNAKARARKRIVGAVLVGVVVVLVGLVLWQTYARPEPGEDLGERDAKILTTARVAAGGGPKRGEAAAEEYYVQVQQLEQDIAALNAQGTSLSAENQALKAQLEQERENALQTISVMERAAVSNQGAVAAPGAAGPMNSQAAPVAAVDPAISAGARPVVAGEDPRPRRSLSTVRMGGASSGAAAGPRVSGADSPEGASGRQAGGSGGNYMSAAAQVYDSANYVPPNAYATARVLVGVDAATGVTSNSDPKPVLFRLTGPAVHVGTGGRFQTTDLTGCLVNGAAYGELSSEKVYIRLQRITCPAGEGRFSVATVEGYASHKGKAGVRGNVISREGGLMGRALVAGTLQGLGNSLSQYTDSLNRNIGVSEGGMLAAPPLEGGQVAAGAAGAGVANAASTLADYFVKRAEQYQPVIEMPTGIEVELVLLTGFQIDRPSPTRRR